MWLRAEVIRWPQETHHLVLQGRGAGALADLLCVSRGVSNACVLWSSSGAKPALHAQGVGTRVWQADGWLASRGLPGPRCQLQGHHGWWWAAADPATSSGLSLVIWRLGARLAGAPGCRGVCRVPTCD